MLFTEYRFVVLALFVARLSEGCLAASPGVAGQSGAHAPRLGARVSHSVFVGSGGGGER